MAGTVRHVAVYNNNHLVTNSYMREGRVLGYRLVTGLRVVDTCEVL